ncbi:cytochrome c1, partial [Ascosphaera pollenicola]
MLGRSILRAVPSKAFARQSFRQSTTIERQKLEFCAKHGGIDGNSLIIRASSTSSSAGANAESPFYLTLTASAATAVAAGSGAWYFYLYGPEAHAMTPAEEGQVIEQQIYNRNSLRRGFQVYREVCSACHSLTRVPWRSFVGTIATVDEMKAMAEENEYDTEPNDQGEIEKRPGKLSDYMPGPYKNEEAAKAANN